VHIVLRASVPIVNGSVDSVLPFMGVMDFSCDYVMSISSFYA